MNRLVGVQLDLLGGPPIPMSGSGRPYSEPRARRKDPESSKTAADMARELQGLHQKQILDCLRTHGPLGKDGIGTRTKLTGVQVARRTAELSEDRAIKWTGKMVKSTAGRPEREWAIAG